MGHCLVLDAVTNRERFLQRYLDQLRKDYQRERKMVIKNFSGKPTGIYFDFFGTTDVISEEVEVRL